MESRFEQDLRKQMESEVFINFINEVDKKNSWLTQREKHIDEIERTLEEKIRQVDELKTDLEKRKQELDVNSNIVNLIQQSNKSVIEAIQKASEKTEKSNKMIFNAIQYSSRIGDQTNSYSYNEDIWNFIGSGYDCEQAIQMLSEKRRQSFGRFSKKH